MLYTLSAYVIWGFLALYNSYLTNIGEYEVIAFRVVASLAVCLIFLLIAKQWKPLISTLKEPKLVLRLGVSGGLILINWSFFIVAALNEKVLEAALGYFITPLITILLGVIFLKEKLNWIEWLSVIIASVAIVVMVISQGGFPWLAITIGLSFALYTMFKRTIPAEVSPLTGLTVETLWATPVAVVIFILSSYSATGLKFLSADATTQLLLLLSGLMTVVPLVLFATGARKISMVKIAIIQYIAPAMSFIVGVFILNEEVLQLKLVGFVLIWVSVILLVINQLKNHYQKPKDLKTA